MFSIINNLIIINFEFTPDPTPLRILQFMLWYYFFYQSLSNFDHWLPTYTLFQLKYTVNNLIN